jgi:CHAD domain-containing protein
VSTTASPTVDGRRLVTATDLGLGARRLVAAPGDTPAVHVRARLDGQLRALLAHEAGTRSGDDPEDLHQMRVAVRRMRAALKAEGAALGAAGPRLQAELKWLGGALGPVRDLDVQLERLRADAEGFDETEREAVEHLLGGLVAERKQARRRMLTALRSPRYGALREALAEAIRSDPVEDTDGTRGNGKPKGGKGPAVSDLVRVPYRRLRKAVGALDDNPADDDLHALRIKGKRLRYAAELTASVPGKKLRGLIDATKNFQDVLGEHQDAVVAEDQIRRLLDDQGDMVDADVVFVAGRLVERERARRTRYRGQWRDAWDEVDRRAKALLG